MNQDGGEGQETWHWKTPQLLDPFITPILKIMLFNPLVISYCHPFQYPISISSSHSLQCLRTFYFLTQLVTASRTRSQIASLSLLKFLHCMSMLACARRRVQSVLPRPVAFSTVLPRQDAQKPIAQVEDLATMLHETGNEVSPIIPEMNNSNNDQSV